MMEILFWVAVGLIIHTYLGYPLSLPLLRTIFGLRPRLRPKSASPRKPKVSLIIAAYNEEAVIEEKIRNSFELEFPRRNLEILIGSDGSTDRTESIVARYAPHVRLVSFNKQGGKAAVLNQLVPMAQGDILVFCDANTMLTPNALQKLLAPFDDQRIGCVCGRLLLHDAGQSALGIGESMYWNLESEIKKLEGRLGIVIGANGGIYAIRKELFEPIPVDRKAMDDFYVTTRVLKAGKAAIYEPQAIGSEETSLDAFGEYHRKVRISQANFNLLGRYLPLLNPLRPLVAYGFFSHKLLRWIAPLLMMFAFTANLTLLGSNPLYTGLFALQGAFYLAAFLGWMGNGATRRSKLLLIPYYFVSMNSALLLGMFKALKGKDGGAWKRVERTTLFIGGQPVLESPMPAEKSATQNSSVASTAAPKRVPAAPAPRRRTTSNSGVEASPVLMPTRSMRVSDFRS
jgi:cellulose synthase/poly-beta-1,6-N-acetylglucosamine synthase-like glycosyltransferase